MMSEQERKVTRAMAKVSNAAKREYLSRGKTPTPLSRRRELKEELKNAKEQGLSEMQIQYARDLGVIRGFIFNLKRNPDNN